MNVTQVPAPDSTWSSGEEILLMPILCCDNIWGPMIKNTFFMKIISWFLPCEAKPVLQRYGQNQFPYGL